jgi:hypothetical protein
LDGVVRALTASQNVASMNKEELRRAVLSAYDRWAKQQSQHDGRLSFLPILTRRKVGPSRFPCGWQQVANRSQLASRSVERLASIECFTSANRLNRFQVAVSTTTPQSRVGTRYGRASGAGSMRSPKKPTGRRHTAWRTRSRHAGSDALRAAAQNFYEIPKGPAKTRTS